jgi:Pyruvate kinase, barrel domain
MSRRAKIVCTLGPATSSPEQIIALVDAGLDVARLNMSHGDHDTHRAAYDVVRAASDASGRSVGVLVDLQGPKIRLGRFAAGPVTLTAGQQFTITTQDVPGDSGEVSVSYHPDARVDDQRAAADPGRGVRRRQRRARRRGRGHALRGDQRRRLPDRSRGDHGANHRRGRAGVAVRPSGRHAGDHRGRHRPGRGRGRGGGRGQGACGLHHDR